MIKTYVFTLITIISFVVIIALAQTSKNLNYFAQIDISKTNHRVVVVIDPVKIEGGTVILDETYSLTGSTSTINASVNINVK